MAPDMAEVPRGQWRFSSLIPSGQGLWAKSAGGGHGLLAHMLDVAATAETILKTEPASSRDWVASQFGLPQEGCARWIGAVAGLHDFGKAIPGFQAKWSEGMVADQAHGLAFPVHACGVTDHSCATAALLGKSLQQLAGADSAWIGHVIRGGRLGIG